MIYDVVVVGAGNAGCSAALAAHEHGCRSVLVIDKCPQEWAGGNGYFTAGAFRTVHAGLKDLLPVIVDAVSLDVEKIDMDPYSAADFTRDVMRLGDGRSDEPLVRTLVRSSRDAVDWLSRSVKVPFTFSFNRQAYEVNGRQRFWGGMVLSVRNGGKGLMAAHQKALSEADIEIQYETSAVDLVQERGQVVGLIVENLKNGLRQEIRATSVILAAGGYEANREMRVKHLGEPWKGAKVRGTPYNTGDGIRIAQQIGAQLYGDWKGCHSTCWDAHAPDDRGDRKLSNQFTKSGYPLGLMINTKGDRFVDEGEDFRNYTYAKFGRAIMQELGGVAFQVWDAKVSKWLRGEEYGDGVVKKIWAETIDELAVKLKEEGLGNEGGFRRTIEAFNNAVYEREKSSPALKWDPAVKDGLSTGSSLPLPKSNWAIAIDQSPFLAVKVTCGITFTFGGIAISPTTAAVLNDSNEEIPGLFSTGEMVGGLFYSNYPGGSGLTAGAVFGRIAGQQAAIRLRVEKRLKD